MRTRQINYKISTSVEPGRRGQLIQKRHQSLWGEVGFTASTLPWSIRGGGTALPVGARKQQNVTLSNPLVCYMHTQNSWGSQGIHTQQGTFPQTSTRCLPVTRGPETGRLQALLGGAGRGEASHGCWGHRMPCTSLPSSLVGSKDLAPRGKGSKLTGSQDSKWGGARGPAHFAGRCSLEGWLKLPVSRQGGVSHC